MPNEIQRSTLKSHACAYAARGWAVFPTTWILAGQCSCGNPTCTSAGKHPLVTKGFESASTDESIVASWWDRWPRANIAIATGAISNLAVLDVDAKNGGLITWDSIQGDNANVDAATVKTGGGGLHLYFEHPGDAIGNRGNMRPGIDFRGDGGYVIAPPSGHASGQDYEWRVDWDPDGEMYEHRQMPTWLETLVRAKPAPSPERVGTVSAEVEDWDRECPDAVLAATDADRGLKKLFKRTRKTRIEGGDASDVDFALAIGLFKAGVRDPLTIAHGLMYSRYKYDADAWLVVGRKSSNYFGLTAKNAINRILEQEATRERLKREQHPAWQRWYDRNERGNAERFRDIYGPDLMYHSVESRWMLWDGARYAGIEHGGGNLAVWGRISDYCGQDLKTLEKLAADEDKPAAQKFAVRCGTASHVSSVERVLRPMRAVGEHDLDPDPYSLTVGNGTVDLESLELRPHDRKDRITKISGAPYTQGWRSPLFEQVLEDALPSAEVREFFGLCMGYSMLGVQPEQRFFFIWGPGATGKSTVLKAIASAAGSYHQSADFQTFLKKSGANAQSASPDLARLSRVRLCTALEVDHGTQMNTGLVKQLSGGDTLVARKLYAEEQEFKPVLALWMCGNDRPTGRVEDDALWRRLIPFNFAAQVAPEKIDTRLETKLLQPSNQAGILSWLVDNAHRYLKETALILPAECLEGIDDYKRHSNPIQPFIEDCLKLGTGETVKRVDVWNAYKGWCSDEGVSRPLGRKQFNQTLRATLSEQESSGIWHWVGARLTASYQRS
jgi:putative DNA primase/helicase